MPRDRVGPPPRAVRDPEHLLATWTQRRLDLGATAEPDAAFRSRWIWWDTPDGRFHSEGTQLVERRAPGQPARLELHRSRARRTLAPTTIATWIARGRPIVPLLWTSSFRRIWFAPDGGQLEWQEWTRLDGSIARTAALIDPGPELLAWWRAAETRDGLGRKTSSPTWPDHALLAVRGWLDGTLDDPAPRLVAGIGLAHELATEDSSLAPAVLEALHEHLRSVLRRASGASAPGHPAWRRALRRALELRVRSRPSILLALGDAVRLETHPALDADRVGAGVRSTRLRTLRAGLRGARDLVGVRSGRVRRRLGDLAEAWETRARIDETDAWCDRIGQDPGMPLDADARLELGARRRRLHDAVADADARIETATDGLPRKRLRRLARALPESLEVTAPPSAPTARKENS